VDDHQIVRTGLISLLEPDPRFSIIGETSTGAEALGIIVEKQPDVVILDLNLPDMMGTELCQRILKSKPETKILILSAFIEKDLVHFCIKAGVKGYLVKDAAVLNLPQHILDIMQGHTIFDPRITKMLTEFIQDREPDYAKLTLREIDVLRLISQGFTNHEIAIHLHLTENTVKGYVKEIYSKLDVHNRIEAVAKARKNWIL
jgi:DNA-binding NarL/FixJ family response regulator